MNCLLQEALRSGTETLETLESKYHLKMKRHGKYPNLVQFKYDQIFSPMEIPLVQECRGIILDEGDNWTVVARPFNKFFNMGEPGAAEIDWSTAKPLEKLDGSLMIVYNYRGDWWVATSGTPDASGPVGNYNTTFKDLFWKTYYNVGYFTVDLEPGFTWMFELMTPENRVVVPHSEAKLTLIGVRHTETGHEVNIHGPIDPICEDLGKYFKVVRAFDLASPEALVSSFETMDGLMQEGYVVVDSKFRRVKVKHPRYVLYHQLVGSLTKKKVLDAVRKNESPEILTYFPTWKAEFDEMEVKYEALIGVYEGAYEVVKNIPVQKDFAMAIQGLPIATGPLFAVRAGKAKDFKDYFSTLRLETLADMVNIKEEVVNEG